MMHASVFRGKMLLSFSEYSTLVWVEQRGAALMSTGDQTVIHGALQLVLSVFIVGVRCLL